MASHGRSGFSRWAMGSVAEKVFHGSSVPILLVKASPQEMGIR
jgi:nucleotide-binding universal stress UspA family protein